MDKEILVIRHDTGDFLIQIHQGLNDAYITEKELHNIIEDINTLTRDTVNLTRDTVKK